MTGGGGVGARPGRLLLARLLLTGGAVCAVVSAVVGLPVLQLLTGTATAPNLEAQVGFVIATVLLLAGGCGVVVREFDHIDWEWPLDEWLGRDI